MGLDTLEIVLARAASDGPESLLAVQPIVSESFVDGFGRNEDWRA